MKHEIAASNQHMKKVRTIQLLPQNEMWNFCIESTFYKLSGNKPPPPTGNVELLHLVYIWKAKQTSTAPHKWNVEFLQQVNIRKAKQKSTTPPHPQKIKCEIAASDQHWNAKQKSAAPQNRNVEFLHGINFWKTRQTSTAPRKWTVELLHRVSI